MPVAELAVPHVPSYVHLCHGCGLEVWVSERTGRPIIDRGGLAICTLCFAQVEGPVEFQDEGQIAEADACERELEMTARHVSTHHVRHDPKLPSPGSSRRIA